MNGFTLLIATALLGVDYGWQPTSDGQLEYIIQLEPVTLIALREGQEIVSQVDPLVRGVRRFRIRVGSDVVPRLGTLPPDNLVPTASAPPPAGVTYGWQVAAGGQVEFLVQIAPERLATLTNEPIVGELPAELRNVARVRIRAGVGALPRQPLAPTSQLPLAAQPIASGVAAGAAGPVAATGASPLGANPTGANPNGANPGLAGGGTTAANGINPTSAQAAATPGSAGRQPSRYDPPPPRRPASVGIPATDAGSHSIYAASPEPTNPPAGSPGRIEPGLAANGTWPQTPPSAGYQAAASGQSNATDNPFIVTGQTFSGNGFTPAGEGALPLVANPGQPPLSDPGDQRGWGSEPSRAAGPASVAPPWGTPDDRFTTDRGQWTASPSSVSPPATGYAPLVSLPASAVAPPAAPAASSALPTSWPTSSFPPRSPGEMASPFLGNQTAWTGTIDTQTAPARPSTQIQPSVVQDVGLSDSASAPRKGSDFWTELSEASQASDAERLREESRTNGAADKPWWPLTLAMLALFASLGGNLYLGWIAVDVYRRYLDMADEEYDDEPDSPRQHDERREDWNAPSRRRERATAGA